jgi:hypothetical protein
MALQIRPDRAHDSSAPISSAFREFSIYSLPEFMSSILFTSPLGSLWGQRAPTQNSEEPKKRSRIQAGTCPPLKNHGNQAPMEHDGGVSGDKKPLLALKVC